MTNLTAQSIALSLGVSALVTVACRKLRMPALLPLLGAGLLLGTSGVQIVDGNSLGPALTGFITVAIGLLIFEGTLHLNREELSRAPRAVWGLLTVGALATWAGTAFAAHWILDLSLPIAILLGASLIVTGPTVVQPILRLVRVSPRVHTALAAEAVLIDPIGVVATVTTLEVLRLYCQTGLQLSLAGHGLQSFLKPFVGGSAIGLAMGVLGYWLLRLLSRGGRPEPQLLNLVAIGVCMCCVGLGEAVTPEAGLAAVTICGVIMARAKVLGATELRAFKELLAVILVGTLFVLLASRFDIAQLRSLTWSEGLFVLALLFAVRPVAIMLATYGSRLSVRERLFAANFAPRGVVALSVASVAATEVARFVAVSDANATNPRAIAMLRDASRLELITFVVVAGSVLLASTFSPLMAFFLRVNAGRGNTVLLIGAHALSLSLARALAVNAIPVRIIDTNLDRVARASAEGFDALAGDATDPRWMDDVGLPQGTGVVLAWTGNHDVDQLVVRWVEERLGPGHAGFWSSRPARGKLEETDLGRGEPIAQHLANCAAGQTIVTTSDKVPSLQRLLGWIKGGRFVLNLSTSSAPQDTRGTQFLGIAEADPPALPSPADHAATIPT